MTPQKPSAPPPPPTYLMYGALSNILHIKQELNIKILYIKSQGPWPL